MGITIIVVSVVIVFAVGVIIGQNQRQSGDRGLGMMGNRMAFPRYSRPSVAPV